MECFGGPPIPPSGRLPDEGEVAQTLTPPARDRALSPEPVDVRPGPPSPPNPPVPIKGPSPLPNKTHPPRVQIDPSSVEGGGTKGARQFSRPDSTLPPERTRRNGLGPVPPPTKPAPPGPLTQLHFFFFFFVLPEVFFDQNPRPPFAIPRPEDFFSPPLHPGSSYGPPSAECRPHPLPLAPACFLFCNGRTAPFVPPLLFQRRGFVAVAPMPFFFFSP